MNIYRSTDAAGLQNTRNLGKASLQTGPEIDRLEGRGEVEGRHGQFEIGNLLIPRSFYAPVCHQFYRI